jgi:hypothetical protein
MRLLLAFRAFFAVLFGRALPMEVLPVGLLVDKASDPAEPSVESETAEPGTADGAETGRRAGALATLGVLQSEGRLLDFLSEDIDGYDDADIGAAVREVHRGCRQALSDHFPLAPIRDEEEATLVTVPEGYDPAEIRLTGNMIGKPPFSGSIRHRGWRATEVRLPDTRSQEGHGVIVPAEVEVS